MGHIKTDGEIHQKANSENGELVKLSENTVVNPIDTTLQRNGETVKIHHSDNDLSLLSPKTEEDFTNPSVIVDFGNGEKGIQDLQVGAGVDKSDGLPTVGDCKKRIGTLESKKRKGTVSDTTYQKGINFWIDELQKAKAREGLKK